jgi:hypothetical protein
LRTGYPAAESSTLTLCPGFHPSTVTPNTIWLFGVSSICIRGSSAGSFDNKNNSRPSSGFADRDSGKETDTA